VRKESQAFRRVLIRVPEAYLLVSWLDCTRPGLLVLDSDGRRVGAMSLVGVSDPGLVAKWLSEVREKPAVERFLLRAEPTPGASRRTSTASLLSALRGHEGVSKVVSKGGLITIDAAPGKLDGATIEKFAVEAKVKGRLMHPVPVAVDPGVDDAPDPAAALRKVAGVWSASGGERPRAYVSSLVLDPAALRAASPGHVLDLEVRSYRFKDMPKGGRGATVSKAPLGVSSVLAVFPDVLADALTVIGRRDFDDKAVRTALARSGSPPIAPAAAEK